jgi:hypothetical protein
VARRAFVISPIGEPGSDVREHADTVFDYIIKPAMEYCRIEPIRSDHLNEPGLISEQMFREILGDDLSIAVLTGRNPNVFYELAVAQAAQRPVIVLAEEGEMLPFDVQDLRCVYYTMKPRPLIEGEYKDKVIKQVQELEAVGWKVKPPFGGGLTARDNFTFFRRARDWGSSRAWDGLLEEAESAFEVMGIGLSGWGSAHARETMLEKAAAGCSIRVMVVDADNAALPHSINEELEDEGIDLLRRRIAGMYEVFETLAQQSENIQVRTITTGCPHMQVARTDRSAVCIPYMYSDQPGNSPLIRCNADHELYKAVAQEFESLWRANAPALPAP